MRARASLLAGRELSLEWVDNLVKQHKLTPRVPRSVETKSVLSAELDDTLSSFDEVDDLGDDVVHVNIDETHLARRLDKPEVLVPSDYRQTPKAVGAADKTLGEHQTLVGAVASAEELSNLLALYFVHSKALGDDVEFRPFVPGSSSNDRRAFKKVRESGWMRQE